MEKFNQINRRIAVAIAVMVTTLTALAGPSLAVDTIPVDPMGGNASMGYTKVAAWVMTIGVPALTIAVVFGIIVRVGFKWLKKIGNRASA